MIGEKTFDALGQRWTLFLGTAAQCAVEEQYEVGFFAVVEDALPQPNAAELQELAGDGALMQAIAAGDNGALMTAFERHPQVVARMMRRIRVSVLRDLAWHGLRSRHPDITLEQVAAIIDDLGQQQFGEIMGQAIQATQGQEAGSDGAATKKPATRAKKPTGKRSSRSGAKKG
tara:strand:+ start:362 stop:880 length:519 start_codon:yes stop_codon:yes gene_type:complete